MITISRLLQLIEPCFHSLVKYLLDRNVIAVYSAVHAGFGKAVGNGGARRLPSHAAWFSFNAIRACFPTACLHLFQGIQACFPAACRHLFQGIRACFPAACQHLFHGIRPCFQTTCLHPFEARWPQPEPSPVQEEPPGG